MTTIPIRNLYYLLCYAWDRLEESEVVAVDAADHDHLANLFARVLARGLEHLLKRGLDQGYEEHREEIAGVRGRIDFAGSIKARSFSQGRAACVFERLTRDVLHNRILKRTASDLLRAEGLDRGLADGLRACVARMADVSNVRLTGATFGRVQLHSNNGFYDFLLRLCRLVHDASAPDERTGRLRFRDFTRDERAMASLFERFLLNFYRREQDDFPRVWAESLRWDATADVAGDLAYLPAMRTDVTLESPTRKVIVDAKYYRQPMQQRFGRDTVRSGHLYQLFAYLKNQAGGGSAERRVEGVLLYPLVDRPLDLRYVVHGHPMRVATVDLADDWRRIHTFLLELIRPPRT